MTISTAALAQFTGTENWYRYSLGRQFLYTDGVKYVAEEAGAYWLIDAIISHQYDPRIKSNQGIQEFQLWNLEVQEDCSAILICEDGNNIKILTQKIPFTDFPLPKIKFYLKDNILLLPSEY